MSLLKILCRGCPFGKHLAGMFRNLLPRLVFTLAFHGGLHHMLFLCRFLLRFWCGLYVTFSCSRSRQVLSGTAEWHLLMFSGMFFSSAGGCIALSVEVEDFVVGFHKGYG